jgi:hypothetical protein
MTKKTPVKKKVKKNPKLFLLKKSEQFFLLPESLVDAMVPEEAHRLAIVAVMEQRKQLLIDAYRGDHYINDVKVVDGLEISLSKLEELYPSLREEISRLDSKLARC